MITIELFLACLSPINFNPENNVTQLYDENSVRFQCFGMAYSTGPLIAPPIALGPNGPVTIELCVRPIGPGTIILLSSPLINATFSDNCLADSLKCSRTRVVLTMLFQLAGEFMRNGLSH